MIPTLKYKFKVMTRLLIHQVGDSQGIPQNYIPLWVGMLPTVARPSQEALNLTWTMRHLDAPPGQYKAHHSMPFEVDIEDTVQLAKVKGNEVRIEWPRWYAEAIKAGAITTWDDFRIGLEVLRAFNGREPEDTEENLPPWR